MSRLRLYVPKKANFGAKILIMLEGSKSSGTHISENNLGTSFSCCLVHFFLAGHSTNWIRKANIWPKMHILDQIWSFWGQKVLIFTGFSKSFGIHIMEKTPRQLVRIVFSSDIRSNGPKMPIFGPKCQFGPNLAVFRPKIQFFGLKE